MGYCQNSDHNIIICNVDIIGVHNSQGVAVFIWFGGAKIWEGYISYDISIPMLKQTLDLIGQ